MTDTQKISEKWLNELKDDLISSYTRKKRKASGRWAKELSSEYNEKNDIARLRIEGTRYTEQMIRGRKVNKKQDKESIRRFVGWAGSTFLKKWVQDKGLNISPYAVAHKIATKGIKVPNKFYKGDFISEVLTDERIRELTIELNRGFLGKAKVEIKNIFR